MSLPADAVIKTTARYQQTNEPPRQKPIIKIDPRHQQELMAHINEANRLASNIRASIDSGRDNPFRPDGEIYKLTNPIVDYYKFGPNQSRAVTPTYAELDYFSNKNKRKRRSNEKAKTNGSAGRESCWRRWFCCCCRCFCSRSSSKSTSDKPQSGNEKLQSPERPQTEDLDKTATTTTKHLDASKHLEEDTPKTVESGDGDATKGTDLRQASSVSLSSSGKQLKTKNDNANKTRPTTQQIKKVVLDDDEGPTMDSSSSIENNIGNAALKKDDDTTRVKGCSLHSHNINQLSSSQEPKTTKVKTVRTSRCVVT